MNETITNRKVLKFIVAGLAVAAVLLVSFQGFQTATASNDNTQLNSEISVASSASPAPEAEVPSPVNVDAAGSINYDDYTYTAFWYRWVLVDGKQTTEPVQIDGLSYENCVKSRYCNPDLEISRTPKN